MSKVKSFLKSEMVLVISAIAAMISCFFVPPSFAYFSYIDFRVLAILFCLMAVISGLKDIGVFDALSRKLTTNAKNTRVLSFVLVMLCFFSSMLITNDVALIAFIPFTILVLTMANQTKHLIFIVVLQTVAANLGSMLTPVGNPQNLYLYSFYQIPTLEFFRITLIIVGISFLLLTLLCLAIKKETINVSFQNKVQIQKKNYFVIYIILFLFCLACVFRLIPYPIVLGVVSITVFFTNKHLFKEIDYGLLFTFICFFIFVGNLGSIDIVKTSIATFIEHKELLSSLLLSQVISNVPAAVLLSSFTDNYQALLLGTNIGGLGTLIASLASLISYKYYVKSPNAKPLRYLAIFSIVNVSLLILLYLITIFIF